MLELYIVRKMYNKSIFIEKELPYQITFEGCISADYNPWRFSSLLILKRHTRDIFSFNKFAVYGWPCGHFRQHLFLLDEELYMELYSTLKF